MLPLRPAGTENFTEQQLAALMVVALATGLRKSNVAGLEWDRIDLARRCCFISGYLTKSGEPIPVPLNEDAIAVIERWKARADDWSAEVPRYVFVYRRRAPIQKLTRVQSLRQLDRNTGPQAPNEHPSPT